MKTAIPFVIALLFVQSSFAQNIDQQYKNMPDRLNPTLSKENRLELIEYYKVRQSDSIQNRFGNTARILVRDTLLQYLKIQNTPNSTFEMLMLQKSETSTITGIIRTVCGPICHSSIRFYDDNWNPSNVQFKMPKTIEWLNKDSLASSTLDKKWVEEVLKDNFISLSYLPEKKQIIAQNNILLFLSEADRKVIEPLLYKKNISYRWVDKNWVKE